MAGIAEVPRLAGVSKSTASRALSGNGYVSASAHARVAGAAAKIGYVGSLTAASLVTGQSRNVGVVTPSISRWFFGEVLEGIESALMRTGYDLALYHVTAEEVQRRRVFDYFLRRKRVDAVISVNIALSEHETTVLESLGTPIICMGGPVNGMRSLSINHVEAARRATEHLIGLGHTKIMHISGDLTREVDAHIHSLRVLGFRQALDEAGLSRHDDFRATDFTTQGGYTTALAVLADPRSRPTAIFAASDELAIGIIIAARQLGIRVPEQLSVVGVDDHDLAPLFGLTTLAQKPKRQGECAVSMLMHALGVTVDADVDFDDSNRDVGLPADLIVRSTTTAPPTEEGAAPRERRLPKQQ